MWSFCLVLFRFLLCSLSGPNSATDTFITAAMLFWLLHLTGVSEFLLASSSDSTLPFLLTGERYPAVRKIAAREKNDSKERADPSFTQKGFSYWKNGTIAFKKHASSNSHKEVEEVSIVLPRTCPDVGEMISSKHSCGDYREVLRK